MYCSLLKINLQGVLSCKFTAAYMSAKKIHRWKEDGRPCSGCLWQVPPRRSFFFFFTRGCCGQWRISISDMKTDAYVFWILISHCVSVTAVLLFIGYSPSCRSRSCSRLTTGRKVVYALKEDFVVLIAHSMHTWRERANFTEAECKLSFLYYRLYIQTGQINPQAPPQVLVKD